MANFYYHLKLCGNTFNDGRVFFSITYEFERRWPATQEMISDIFSTFTGNTMHFFIKKGRKLAKYSAEKSKNCTWKVVVSKAEEEAGLVVRPCILSS
jgi:hypothetical protein